MHHRTLLLFVMTLLAALCAGQQAVTTHHYDNRRTGWNSQETVLTPAVVGSSSFGLLTTVALDDQVDAQPLVVPGVTITSGASPGTHDVVYIVTEANSVYAIDAHSGAVLLQSNLGVPVHKPLGCNNNGPNVGITSTPVIDLGSKTLYAIAYTQDAAGPTYRLHALDLGNLTDKITPRVVAASHKLSDGTTYSFRPMYQRQRAALLLANGSVYAGFGSFCDQASSLSRGWLLGWNAGTLAPLPGKLLNTQSTDPDDYFLSSIWMSGFGPAADDSGNVFFVTGNSDFAGTNYDGITSLQESVIKLSPSLGTVLSLFTPSNQASLDETDADFGSGGVTLLPDQAGTVPHLAVAAGKRGVMFLMNADKLGGFSTVTNNVLGTYGIGGECWCGMSYFQDPSDGLGRVVTSGGRVAGLWKLAVTPRPSLTRIKSSPSIGGGQDPGFFTSVSSNGTSSPVIWALSRPISAQAPSISLFAFDPETPGKTMSKLYSGPAGSWPNAGGDAFLVPVVANGEVFVASNKQLHIFGVKPPSPPLGGLK